MDNRLEQFRKDIKTCQSVVVCVKCGSTSTGQNSIHELCCYTCRNSCFWDAKRFSIAQEASEQDAIAAFQVTNRPPEADKGFWPEDIYSGLEPFAHLLADLPPFGSQDKYRIRRADFDALAKQWAETKTLIDAVLENLVTSEDSIIEDRKKQE